MLGDCGSRGIGFGDLLPETVVQPVPGHRRFSSPAGFSTSGFEDLRSNSCDLISITKNQSHPAIPVGKYMASAYHLVTCR